MMLDEYYNSQLGERDKRAASLGASSRPSDLVGLNEASTGSGGKFIRIEGKKFDIILNILIGIKRSLSTIVRMPG